MTEIIQNFRVECRDLLMSLKSTVEVLLGNQTSNVWNTYGGLTRLTNVVSSILKHGLTHEQGCWSFILGLRVLMPTTAPWLERHRLATAGNSDRSYTWIQQRLQEHTMSSYLKVLLDDCNHLKICYSVGAFLRQEDYAAALLICLQAVENNQLAKLTELDPRLLIGQCAANCTRDAFHHRQPLPQAFNGAESQFGAGIGIPNQCKLRRGHRVEPSKASYYRRRCHQEQFGHSEYGGLDRQEATIPKSATWDCGLTSSGFLLEVSLASNGREDVLRPSVAARRDNRPKWKSKSCVCLLSTGTCDDNTRDPRRSLGHRKPISDTRSLPNDLNVVSVKSGRGLVRASTSLVPSRKLRELRSTAEDVLQELRTKVEDEPQGRPRTRVEDRLQGSKAASGLQDTDPKPEERDGNSATAGQGTQLPSTSGVVVPIPAQARTNSWTETPNVKGKSPAHHARSKSDAGVVLQVASSCSTCRQTKEAGDPPSTLAMSSSLPANLQGQVETAKQDERYSSQTFRRPMEGQSLTSFLSSQDFRTCAELDRENAHFSISEALISAIEYVKCNQQLKIAEEDDQDSDDEEIKHLKQRIRIRRRERLEEKVVVLQGPRLLSDGRTDTTTSQTPSPCSSSSDNKSGVTSDSVDPIDLSDGSEGEGKLTTLTESGLSLSLASLYSDADIQRPLATAPAPSEAQESPNKSSSVAESTASLASAESVALSLLKRFSEKQLPKASDLEWLVSEEEVPQKLLPLPTSWPISPDDADNLSHSQQTRLRGNLEWAPPRQQIIFYVHPPPQRKVIMAKQNYRCAGCGTKVERSFIKRFRYCDYLGKYFCQCCHNNNLASIPGRILGKWDFNKYYISNFAKHLLERMARDPLYDISDVNPLLYRRVRALQQAFHYRSQLYHLKDFIRVCRRAESMAERFDKLPDHWLTQPHLYSMTELEQVKSGEMNDHLKPLVTQSLAHVAQCQLCQARGFFCEFCKNVKEVIFPFQLGKVIQCPGCWSCYHIDCYIAEKCPKCARLESRRKHLQSEGIE